MTTLREAATQALGALEGGADSWQLVGPAIDALKAALVEDALQKFSDVNQELEAALAEPTLSQQLAAAGFTRRDTRLECDECGGKFTRQMLPIHKCEPVQEPVAWMTVRLNVPIQTTARKDVADEWLKWGEVRPLFAAPPQRKPLTEEEIGIICKKAREDAEAGWPYGPNYVLLTIRGVERAHGIT